MQLGAGQFEVRSPDQISMLAKRACVVSRREASLALLGSVSGVTGAACWPSQALAAQPARGCGLPLDPALSAAFMEAVYATVQQQQVVAVEQLQRERFKLQNQEFRYFAAANKDRLPALPDLSDNSGGLSNPTYFNFVSYILWKSVAKHLLTPDKRTLFCSSVGQQLLQQLMPDAQKQLQAAAQAAGRSGQAVQQAPAAAVLLAAQQLLQQLQERGYICHWQLVWGSLPGGWPSDWWASEQQLVDADDVLVSQQPIPAGTNFQLKLHQPVDIEGAVALRSEEDGFWSRHVSSLLTALLQAGGYTPTVDEYFYQDSWSGPQSAADKLLLLFGDPLQQVDIPFYPATLVQNWTV